MEPVRVEGRSRAFSWPLPATEAPERYDGCRPRYTSSGGRRRFSAGVYAIRRNYHGCRVSLPALVWVLSHSEAELGPRLVLLVLAEHSHDDGSSAFPSVETMMQRSRLSRRSVQGALRRLEAEGHIEKTGVRSSGTTVYRVILDREVGGADSAPGGADFDAEGAQISTSGGADSAPDPSRNQQLEPTTYRGPAKVDRKQVSKSEGSLAGAVLEEWNRQTGQRLGSKEWFAKIVMRVREHPELSAEDHAAIIAANLAEPWWQGDPSPSVVYGNGAIFEKSLGVRDRGPKPAKGLRYGRGLTTKQTAELFGLGDEV